MGKYFYHVQKRSLRKMLRSVRPFPERVLWQRLKQRQLAGVKFRRQASVGRYVVDFYAPQKKLIIEIDGAGHMRASAQTYDQERDAFLSSLGLRVIRFTNVDILENMEGVIEVILASLDHRTPPPAPPRQGGV